MMKLNHKHARGVFFLELESQQEIVKYLFIVGLTHDHFWGHVQERAGSPSQQIGFMLT